MPATLRLFLPLAFALLFATGCGKFETTVTETLTVSLDMQEVYKDANINPTTAFPNNRIPATFKREIPLRYSTTVDLRQRKEFVQYGDKIDKITIDWLSYEVVENTLNVPLPGPAQKWELLASPLTGDNLQPIAALPSFDPGQLSKGSALFVEDGRAALETQLRPFALRLHLHSKLTIDGSQSTTVPQGKITIKLTLHATVSLFVTLADLPNSANTPPNPPPVENSTNSTTPGSTTPNSTTPKAGSM